MAYKPMYAMEAEAKTFCLPKAEDPIMGPSLRTQMSLREKRVCACTEKMRSEGSIR